MYGSGRYLIFDWIPLMRTSAAQIKDAQDALVASAMRLEYLSELALVPAAGSGLPLEILYREGDGLLGSGGWLGPRTLLFLLSLGALLLTVVLLVVIAVKRGKLSEGSMGYMLVSPLLQSPHEEGERGPAARVRSHRRRPGGGGGDAPFAKDLSEALEGQFLDDLEADEDDEPNLLVDERGTVTAKPNRDGGRNGAGGGSSASKAKANKPPKPTFDGHSWTLPPSDDGNSSKEVLTLGGRDMAVQVVLEGGEEVRIDVPMSGISSTEEMLRAAFDACAETVGMELASESKQIVLRYVTSDGREKRLNTKVKWDELKRANLMIIRIEHAGPGGAGK